MKGRNSRVVSIRLDDDVYTIMEERATKKDLTISEYIKQQIIRSVNNSVNTMNQLKLYRPGVKYQPGERVLVKKGKRLVEVTVPELDAEGQPMW